MQEPLTPELVVRAYAAGAFPMACDRDSAQVDWYSPDPRAVLPLDNGFRVRRSLAKRVRNAGFRVSRDEAFVEVIDACAQPREDDPQTWINPAIREVFVQLHDLGVAHSVEAWRDGVLVGGLYGMVLGGAFFGESMFSRCADASQVCLVRLVEHLRSRAFSLLDVQFVNPHLEQFGIVELPRAEYLRRLDTALAQPATWDPA